MVISKFKNVYILLNQVMILTSTYVFQILIGKQPLQHVCFSKKVNLPNKKLAIQKFLGRTRCTTKQLLGRMHSPRKMGQCLYISWHSPPQILPDPPKKKSNSSPFQWGQKIIKRKGSFSNHPFFRGFNSLASFQGGWMS